MAAWMPRIKTNRVKPLKRIKQNKKSIRLNFSDDKIRLTIVSKPGLLFIFSGFVFPALMAQEPW